MGYSQKQTYCSRSVSNPQTDAFRRRFFPGTSLEQWNDWRWQLQHRITTAAKLAEIIHLSPAETKALNQERGLPLSITPYYASLIDSEHEADPLRRTVVPTIQEFLYSLDESQDPLGEVNDSPVYGLVHRYPDRVLFLVSNRCSVYCRYCTRSRIFHQPEIQVNKEAWQNALQYISSHSVIRDVLLSGGDPLLLSDGQLQWLLEQLQLIPHVEFLRIGTKVPVVLPQRITTNLLRILKKHHPLWMSIHFTHYREITPEVAYACNRLADAGIPLGSQTVLLKGINDSEDVIKTLMHALLKIRVKPYYLYQCDPILGSSHFRTPVQTGLNIIKSLRGYTSGYAVPNYVIDAPGGGGKIPLLPEYVLGKEDGKIVLKNYLDKTYYYPDIP